MAWSDEGYTTSITRDRSTTSRGILIRPEPLQIENYPKIQNVNEVSTGLPAKSITFDKLTINKLGVNDYISSSNFKSGTVGWRIHGNGDVEFSSGVFRGDLSAKTGYIGGWHIDSNGIYYDGTGTPYIKTSATVEEGSNGVILDSAGIRGYSSLLGEVFNLPSDGSAPSFSSGVITSVVFEVNTNSIIRTSESVGDGTSSSAGILINNSGIYALGANQTPSTANVKLLRTGDAYFKGKINASSITSTDIAGGTITGTNIVGATIRTSTSGQRTEIDTDGIRLVTSAVTGKYGTFKYGDGTKYGTGTLVYINNSTIKVPFYVAAEQNVADIHLYNRSNTPSGAAEPGDLVVVNSKLHQCITAGTPGTWEEVSGKSVIPIGSGTGIILNDGTDDWEVTIDSSGTLQTSKVSNLLLETGDKTLLETGDKILI